MNLNELFRYNGKRVTVPARRTVFSAGDRGNVMYVMVSDPDDIYVGDEDVERAEVGDVWRDGTDQRGTAHGNGSRGDRQ